MGVDNVKMITQGEILRLAIKGTGKTVEETALLVGLTRGTLYNYFKLEELDDNTKGLFKKKLGIDIEQNVQQNPPKMVKVDGEYVARSHYKIRGDNKQEKTVEHTLQEPTKEYKPQPTSTVDKLATALLTANESVSKLSDSVKAAAASIDTVVSTNAQLANHVMQHTQPSNSDELRMLTALRMFLHTHVIDKGLMAAQEVQKELDTLIDAQRKASSKAYSFGT